MEKILLSFLFCGAICLIAQIILDNTKLTPGHITSIFVVLGALLDTFNIYDIIYIVKKVLI
jgi:stage V sporulation protein AE